MEAAWLVVRKHHLWFYSFGIKCDVYICRLYVLVKLSVATLT